MNKLYNEALSEYKFVIPTYDRTEVIFEKSLPFLDEMGVNPKQIYIFYFEEDKLYDTHKIEGLNWIASKESIMDTRQHIVDYFDEGEMIIELDDDIDYLYGFAMNQNDKKTKYKIAPSQFQDMLQISFQPNKVLWGVAATNNPLGWRYVRRVGYHLTSITASFYGYKNDKRIKYTVKEKEDYERVCQTFSWGDTTITKWGIFGPKTNYWKNAGGIQSHYDFEERKQVQRWAAYDLCAKYPKYVYNQMRKNGIMDIRFQRKKELGFKYEEIYG